jgi:hypothetical protein
VPSNGEDLAMTRSGKQIFRHWQKSGMVGRAAQLCLLRVELSMTLGSAGTLLRSGIGSPMNSSAIISRPEMVQNWSSPEFLHHRSMKKFALRQIAFFGMLTTKEI